MVTMSQKEFQRVKVIENAAGGRLSVREASRLLQLSERQVQRLKRRYQPDSVDWVQHGNRGRAMPWAVSLPQQQLILRLARGKYQGFNDISTPREPLHFYPSTVSVEHVGQRVHRLRD
jgi:transposase